MKKNYFLILIVLFFFSCQKEISTEVSNTNTSTQVDVYVAGGEVSADRNTTIAKYWKNGIPFSLNDASKRGAATSIAVSGNDLYVAGYLANVPTSGVPGDYSPHAVYWNNGNPTFLPENTRPVENGYWNNYPISSTISLANSIFISGSDVYIAGQEKISREKLPDPNDPFGAPSGIDAISALYWKNGKAVYLILGSYGGSHADEANSIFVAGQDVYACGALDARYWKNGTSFYLGGSNTDANSVFVSGSDVYVAGRQEDGAPVQGYFGTYYRSVAKYWKNGTPINVSDGTKDAYATSIAVLGSDVYVAGAEDGVAKYWKNGDPVILGDASKNSDAYSIFLVKK